MTRRVHRRMGRQIENKCGELRELLKCSRHICREAKKKVGGAV